MKCEEEAPKNPFLPLADCIREEHAELQLLRPDKENQTGSGKASNNEVPVRTSDGEEEAP